MFQMAQEMVRVLKTNSSFCPSDVTVSQTNELMEHVRRGSSVTTRSPHGKQNPSTTDLKAVSAHVGDRNIAILYGAVFGGMWLEDLYVAAYVTRVCSVLVCASNTVKW
ncbi:hypothetical protein CLAIMM_00316 [Cladophialophora immunda]|nr:hypothetical protein CLAIMM_00316 [Cladophialophora immunda]